MTYRRYRTTRIGRRVIAMLALGVAVVVGVEAGARAHEAVLEPGPRVIAPGVTVANLNLSGMTRAQAERALRRSLARPLVLEFRGQTWRFNPRTLGARHDVEGAVRAATAAPAGTRVRLEVRVGQRRLMRWARRFAEQFDREPVNARIVLRDLRPEATRARVGLELFPSLTAYAVTSELRSYGRGPVRPRARAIQPKVTRADLGPAIVIKRESNRLILYRGGPNGLKVVRRFGVATGQPAYPTPLGNFEIVDLQRDPWWYPPSSDWAAGQEPVPPGPGNPLGTRWMGLSEPLIGIHGTPDAASIGYSASHGCIRMLVPDAEWLFERVEEGTKVFIVSA